MKVIECRYGIVSVALYHFTALCSIYIKNFMQLIDQVFIDGDLVMTDDYSSVLFDFELPAPGVIANLRDVIALGWIRL